MNKTVVTKARFAEMKGRVPSAVSNWIAEGKISPAALVGSGIRARIWVERAEADLARALDPAQQAAQPHPVGLDAPAFVGDDDDDEVPIAPRLVPSHDDLARRRKADADRAEHEAEQKRRQLEVDAGRWVEAEAAKRAFARELAKVVSETETFLTATLARELADHFGVDAKQMSVMVRQAWRRHRGDVAEGARQAIDRRETMAVAAE